MEAAGFSVERRARGGALEHAAVPLQLLPGERARGPRRPAGGERDLLQSRRRVGPVRGRKA